jgi:alkylation response protein AidB-like acyl-CoA dehydrogenase
MSAEASVDDFAVRARTWLADHMPPAPQTSGDSFLASTGDSDEDVLARIAICRDLQRRLYEGGFAGICVPVEYGGRGLTPAHQAAFNHELDGYDYPADIQASTFIPAMALLLEFGSEEQKLRHVPAMLRGEEIWVQFLSEPAGGSDAAGAVTTARRDGDHWVLNGSKTWTTAAWYGDWAICLARTDWDAEKHNGLTVFSFPVNTAGIDVHRIELVNGSREFCQEFLTDVVVPDTDRIGNVNGGWEVVTRWLYHERTISGGSMYVTGRGNRSSEGPYDTPEMIARARTSGVFADARARALIGEAHALMLTRDALVSSVTAQMASGMLPLHAAAMLRLFSGTSTSRRATIGMELCGRDGVVWSREDDTTARLAAGYLARQVACIGGGTTEMARNVISERLLAMPREERTDAGPFRSVPRGRRNR